MRDSGMQVLNDAMTIAKAAGVEADTVLFDTLGERLAEAVAEAARQWKADLVVVGTHGRRGVGRMLLGSGAEQVIRLAPVPVLVIRSETASQPAAH
jgi:nucleotide-binding universal stress UspA family protein